MVASCLEATVMQSISTDVIMKLLTLYYADSDSNRWRARWRAEAAAANSGMQRMQRLWYAADAEDAVRSCRETTHCRKSASPRVQIQTRKVSTKFVDTLL